MKHKTQVIIQTNWLLLTMLACVILVGLTACSGGDSKTGYAHIQPIYPEVESARNLLRPHYPEVASYPTILSEQWSHTYGVYYDGMIYLSQLWVKKNANEPVWGACLVYHEVLHSRGIGHGPQMDRLVKECHDTV